MNTQVFSDYDAMSKHASEVIIEQLKEKPESVLVLPGGNTPAGMIEYLVQAFEKGDVSYKDCYFIGLDEWVGLGREDVGGCQQFLYENFLNKVDADPQKIFFFNAKAGDLNAECQRVDQKILELGGIDISVLGIGMNGHLGFNEPGVSFDNYSHIINLDSVTTTVGQKYFEESAPPTQGITLGIQNLLESKKVILLANGEKKAPIIKKLLDSEPTNEIPATALKLHSNAFVFLDKESAGEYRKTVS